MQIDPGVLSSLTSLEWVARTLAKGLMIGKHHAKSTGSGLEFSQFRTYAQGDDLRLLDWKMYAKTGKYFIRQSTIDMNHRLTVHIDNSKSMDYRENGISKLDLSKIITAALTHVMAQQSDEFTWVTSGASFNKGQGIHHWKRSLISLYEVASGDTSYEISDTHNNNGIHLWITDLYEDLDHIKKSIQSLSGPNRELVILHLIGEKEEHLSFPKNTKFIELESGKSLQVDSTQYKKQYAAALGQHILEIKRYCEQQAIVYKKIRLQDDLTQVLRSFIQNYNYLSAI